MAVYLSYFKLNKPSGGVTEGCDLIYSTIELVYHSKRLQSWLLALDADVTGS